MEFTSEWFKSNLKWMAAKLIPFAFGCPSLAKIIPHTLQEKQLELTVWMGFLFRFLMLWLKSFLEQQVLFTVKLTTGASLVKRIIRMEASVWFETTHFQEGKIALLKVLWLQGFLSCYGAVKWEAKKQKNLCVITACIHLRALHHPWNSEPQIRPNWIRNGRKQHFACSWIHCRPLRA